MFIRSLDDIEIELKMCERYMRQAEDKNDMINKLSYKENLEKAFLKAGILK